MIFPTDALPQASDVRRYKIRSPQTRPITSTSNMTVFSAAASSDSVTPQGGGDPAPGDLVLAVEALGIDAEQHLDAGAGPLRHLGCGHSSVAPGGQPCRSTVVS